MLKKFTAVFLSALVSLSIICLPNFGIKAKALAPIICSDDIYTSDASSNTIMDIGTRETGGYASLNAQFPNCITDYVGWSSGFEEESAVKFDISSLAGVAISSISGINLNIYITDITLNDAASTQFAIYSSTDGSIDSSNVSSALPAVDTTDATKKLATSQAFSDPSLCTNGYPVTFNSTAITQYIKDALAANKTSVVFVFKTLSTAPSASTGNTDIGFTSCIDNSAYINNKPSLVVTVADPVTAPSSAALDSSSLTASWADADTNVNDYSLTLYKCDDASGTNPTAVLGATYTQTATSKDLSSDITKAEGYYYYEVTANPSSTATDYCASSAVKSNIIHCVKTDSILPSSDITVLNSNADSAENDSVTVNETLSAGEIVNVYSNSDCASGHLIYSKTVTSATNGITVDLGGKDKLDAPGGDVYVTRKEKNKAESTPTQQSYAPKAPLAANISVANNGAGGSNDSVTVSNIPSGASYIAVYLDSAGTGTQYLGVASTGKVDLGSPAILTTPGTVYVGLKNGSLISKLTPKAYGTEPIATPTGLAWSSTAKGTATWNSVGTAKDYTVKLYQNISGTDSQIGDAVTASGTSVSLSDKIVANGIGSYYFTVTANPSNSAYSQSLESAKVTASYDYIAGTPVDSDNITVVNNNGTGDTVDVKNLNPNDIIKVYKDSSHLTLLGSKTVNSGAAPGAGSVNILLTADLDTQGGTVYVTVTSVGLAESGNTSKNYDPQAPLPTDITITNNPLGSDDSVTINNLVSGETVTVVNHSNTATLATNHSVSGTSAVIDLGKDVLTDNDDSLDITIASTYGSVTVSKDYAPQPPAEGNITVNNSSSDSVTITGTYPKDSIFNVYDGAGNQIGTQTLGSQTTDVTVDLTSSLSDTGGSVFVTFERRSLESVKIEKKYAPLPPVASNITVDPDLGQVTVGGLVSGETVYFYSNTDCTTTYGTEKTATTGSVTQNVSLNVGGGTIYIKTEGANGLKSDTYTSVDYAPKSPLVGNVTVTNNPGNTPGSDTVAIPVSVLSDGETVNVYSDPDCAAGHLLGTSAVSSSDVSIHLTLKSTGGSVYIVITGANGLKSSVLTVPYSAQDTAKFTQPVNLEWNATTFGLATWDSVTDALNYTVNLYKGTVDSNNLVDTYTDVTDHQINLADKIISTGAGSYLFTVTANPTDIDLFSSSDPKSVAGALTCEQRAKPDIATISVANNTGSNDTVTVSGLLAGDSVYVYNDSTCATLLGSSSVLASPGNATVTLTGTQLKSYGDTVYVKVKNVIKALSDYTSVAYAPEAPSASSITVAKGTTGIKVSITGLTSGEKVNVYSNPGCAIADLLTSKDVTGASADIDLTSAPLSGTLYFKIVGSNSLESPAVTKTYDLNVSSGGGTTAKTDKVVDGSTGGSSSGSSTAKITPSDTNTATTNNVIVNVGSVTVTAPASVFGGALGSDTSSWLVLSQAPSAAATQTQVASAAQTSGVTPVITLDVDLTRYYSNGTSEAVHQLGGNAQVVLKLTAAQIAAISDASKAKLLYYDTAAGKFTDMGATFNLAAGTATFTTSHLSTYVVAVGGSTSGTGSVGVTYDSHVQNKGWLPYVKDGAQSGTTGKKLRLEAINVKLTGDAPKDAAIVYQTYIQGKGWQNAASNGALSGTTGKSLRVEALRVTLSGLSGYKVKYRVHMQNLGWQPWVETENGTSIDLAKITGKPGKSLRIEAVEIVIEKEN